LEAHVAEWIRKHAPVEQLCEVGGWPNIPTLNIDVCSRTSTEWIVNIDFDEIILEISECDLSEYNRCGKFTVTFDTSGDPVGIRLNYRL